MTLDFIDLFAGIGGNSLGLERAGMRCVAQVEIEPWCRRLLTKHWPTVPKFGDVRDVGAHNLPPADLIAGGFPCQDISYAGGGAGITGARSGLWAEFARIIGEVRPSYVLVENVPALLARGLGRVIGDLAAIGYDAEWDCIPASAVGAPHRRDRIWIVAYPNSLRRVGGESAPANEGQGMGERPWLDAGTASSPVPDAYRGGREVRGEQNGRTTKPQLKASRRDNPDRPRSYVADAERDRLEEPRNPGVPRERSANPIADTGWWTTEPAVGRVADGVPGRVDRLRGLGNAVVPQVVEWIGRRIVEAEAQEEVA